MLNGRGEESERKDEDDCWGRHPGNSYICMYDPPPNYLCIMRDVGSQNQLHFAQKLAFMMYGLSFCTRHWLEEEST